ncbi:unnamed protein product [Triticum aestivum]|uniref:Uncharacterized protein n=5 Tax=Triticinae TaxID=1648030 RepID=A0A9R1EW43_WHEAT|nr:uncharacterized protein LOC109761357 [Aegilops tauschii subsp. strangulata]XP_044333857.1 uncharacterized protein LOC123054203 [Triticum aestivum]KAF7017817.1 hypothetical protein CFC21_031184 [Triticum aestivum]SPT19469.1 unnamed protein product [Triticum aestivum]
MAGGSPSPSQAGATPNRLKRKASASSAVASSSTSLGADEAADEGDIEELEREVADLGRRILEHRRDAAARFIDATVSRLVALRPPACVEVPSESQPAAGGSHAEAEQNISEKLKMFKSKTEANIVAIPKVLDKMNKCIARMEKVQQLNVNIHPAFQRKR